MYNTIEHVYLYTMVNFSIARKRLQKERERDIHSYSLSELQETDTILWWDILIPGPDTTPYEGKLFRVRIEYPSDYPFRSPQLVFQTPIFHPNITPTGNSSNLLNEPWNPAYSLQTLCQRIHQILLHPNMDCVYNQEAMELLRRNPVEFANRAARHT